MSITFQQLPFNLSVRTNLPLSRIKLTKLNISPVKPKYLALNCGFFPRTTVRGKIYVASATSKRKHIANAMCFLFGCSNYLSSRVVSNKVLSAQVSLTSVFGMRTGGPHRYRHRNGIYSRFPLYISVFFESADSQPHSINLIFVPFKPKAH